jgi:hypothetical protein
VPTWRGSATRGEPETERTVVTVYYTDDWQAAYFDEENY